MEISSRPSAALPSDHRRRARWSLARLAASLGLALAASACGAAPPRAGEMSDGPPQIGSGVAHTCLLTEQGSVLCWDANDFGQLGVDPDRTPPRFGEPVQVPGLDAGVTGIAVGWYHTCVLMADASVRCWGRNEAANWAMAPRWPMPPPRRLRGSQARSAFSPPARHILAASRAAPSTAGARTPSPSSLTAPRRIAQRPSASGGSMAMRRA
jgi:hypothetical protein